MMVRNIFIKLVVVSSVLLATAGISSAQTTELPGDIYYMSGLLNFTRGQAVSLNFTNVDREPRSVALNFADANGNVLKTAMMRALPGQTVSLNFSFTELTRTSSTRVGIRGGIALSMPTEPDADPLDPDLGLAGIELFDVQSSKTLIGLLLPAVRNANVFFPTDQ